MVSYGIILLNGSQRVKYLSDKRMYNIITGDSRNISGTVKFGIPIKTEYKFVALSLIRKDDGAMMQTKNEIEKIYLLYNISDGNVTLTSGNYTYPFEFILPEVTPMDTGIGEIRYELVLQFKNPRRLGLSETYKRTIIILPETTNSIQVMKI